MYSFQVLSVHFINPERDERLGEPSSDQRRIMDKFRHSEYSAIQRLAFVQILHESPMSMAIIIHCIKF